jgi:hypothetical protein
VLAAEVNLLGGPSEAGRWLLARDWVLHGATGEPWRGYDPVEIRNWLVVASESIAAVEAHLGNVGYALVGRWSQLVGYSQP